MRTVLRYLTAALALLCLAEITDLAWLSGVRATITTTASKVVAAGNGSTTQWNFSFVGVSTADLIVSVTNSSGITTVLTLNTQYSVTFTPQAPNSVWSVGGFVTYPLTGSPLAVGNTLTIQRQVPYTQTTPFQNQGQFLPQAVEMAVDLLTMQVQQLNTLFSGALVAPVTDSQPLSPLPAAAARANLALCFDSTGYNPIACTAPSSGVISSAMQPVVDAASLAAGRTAFGLGTMATENINGGTCGGESIQDDGGGFARVVNQTFVDGVNKTVSCNYNQTYHVTSGPITFTLGQASATYFNGFAFTINSAVGVTTVAPYSADNFNGVASGTSVSIPQGTTCRITTNAASTATWWMDCTPSQPALAAVASAGALTLTLYAPNIGFRDTTLANGDSRWATPAGGLSITIPSGATLGTSNSVPFRAWLFVTYNSGTPVLGIATCSAPGVVYGCAAWETIRNTGTAITSGADSGGILYTASAVTNDAVRIVGYADYASGLSTAGTWASAPTTLQICAPPFVCKRPGDIVQIAPICSTTTSGTTTSATFVALTTGQTCPITPTSAINLVRVFAQGNMTNGAGIAFLQLARGSTLIGNPITQPASNTVPTPLLAWDSPGVITSTTYGFQGKIAAAATLTYPTASTGSTIELWEIMGSIEPANDNTELRMVG